MDILSKKFRLIWKVDSSIIANDYQMDYSGSLTNLVNAGDLGFMESNVYQNILDKIEQDSLIEDPNLP